MTMERPAYLRQHHNLTEHQLNAILHSGSPLLILAGPGSGKTEVITWRVAHLILSGKAKPQEFLVTTFTNKAALELKDRIKEKLTNVNVELMQVSTIHAFCADLLRQYADYTPFPGGFQILDESAQLLFVYSHRKDLGLSSIIKNRPYEFFSSVIRMFNLITEELVDVSQLLNYFENRLKESAETEAELWSENLLIAAAYNHYRQLLQEEGVIDFPHMQFFTYQLLKHHPEVRSALQEKYRYILVDEYQDTNVLQIKILTQIMPDGRNLTVVGDDDQSIYRFRGATVENLMNFEKTFPGAEKIILPHNFRSYEPIVRASLRVIEQNRSHLEKPLQPRRYKGNDVLLVYENNAFQEAAKVVEILEQLKTSGKIKRYGDVAILLRSVRSYFGPYVNALQSRNIPYHIIGDASFFEREEIKQLLHLFNFLATNKEWGDRFLRDPFVGLSEHTCEVLKQFKGNLIQLTSEAELEQLGIKHADDRRKLWRLLQLKQKVQKRKYHSISEIFYEILAAIRCLPRLEEEGDTEALVNLGQLSSIIATWDTFSGRNHIYPFLEYMKLLREGGMEPVRIPPEDAVQIMTIHQAKGLEFPLVVLGAAMEGRLPTRQRKDRYEIPSHLRASKLSNMEEIHIEDERRLFYVAATRAKDLLIVATADVVNKRGGGPSRFVSEMFGENLKQAAQWTQEKILVINSNEGQSSQPRRRYSFSDIIYYVQCPLRYKYAMVYGLEAPWQEPVNFGANVHRILEKIHRYLMAGEKISDLDIRAIVDKWWIPSKKSSEAEEERYKAAAVRQIENYIHHHAPDPNEIIQPESNFVFELDHYVLSGKVDLIKKCADESLEIVDFKTSKMGDYELQGFSLQIDLYSLGIEATLNKRVKRETLYFLGDNQMVTFDWTPERKEHSRQEIISILENIEASHFEPNPAFCPFCTEFQKICPYSG